MISFKYIYFHTINIWDTNILIFGVRFGCRVDIADLCNISFITVNSVLDHLDTSIREEGLVFPGSIVPISLLSMVKVVGGFGVLHFPLEVVFWGLLGVQRFSLTRTFERMNLRQLGVEVGDIWGLVGGTGRQQRSQQPTKPTTEIKSRVT